jgi:ADP-ribosylglycohydrolase
MLPIAIYVANEPLDKIILTTHLATRTTNHIPHAEVVSTIYSLIIANMITGQGEKVFNAVNEFYTSNGLSAHHDALAEFQAWKQSNEPKGTDHVFDSFWSAWAAYSAHQGDFQQAVEMAITTGGCCNETAAIAGSLVGLSEGIDAIPQEYVQVIKIGSPAVHEVTNFVRRFKAIEATS